MRVLFVHGMGRSPLSGWPMLRHLRREGLSTSTFGYVVSVEDFPQIRDRLVARISALAAQGDYVLVGHSLGGVLLRAALNVLPGAVAAPRHLFLLGSPVKAARLAGRLQGNPIYRRITGDCGQLLASNDRMDHIGPVAIVTTSIVGTRGIAMAAGGLAARRGWRVTRVRSPACPASACADVCAASVRPSSRATPRRRLRRPEQRKARWPGVRQRPRSSPPTVLRSGVSVRLRVSSLHVSFSFH